jgi:NAD(P)H-dependent flavin oxidoreductase YrpB (nitropropane dioxygenase family)
MRGRRLGLPRLRDNATTARREDNSGVAGADEQTKAKSDPDREHAWQDRLLPYFRELGIDCESPRSRLDIPPFGDAMCTVVEDAKPEVVSFHFGLPAPALLARVKAAGCRVMSSATTVEEALWLEAGGVDAIIAQGYEAGGHRGMFLAANLSSARLSRSPAHCRWCRRSLMLSACRS